MSWRKSSYSGPDTDCVEALLDQVVRVRDTKDRPGGTLDIHPDTWAALLQELKSEPR